MQCVPVNRNTVGIATWRTVYSNEQKKTQKKTVNTEILLHLIVGCERSKFLRCCAMKESTQNHHQRHHHHSGVCVCCGCCASCTRFDSPSSQTQRMRCFFFGLSSNKQMNGFLLCTPFIHTKSSIQQFSCALHAILRVLIQILCVQRNSQKCDKLVSWNAKPTNKPFNPDGSTTISEC